MQCCMLSQALLYTLHSPGAQVLCCCKQLLLQHHAAQRDRLQALYGDCTLMTLTCSTGPKYAQISWMLATVTHGCKLPKYLKRKQKHTQRQNTRVMPNRPMQSSDWQVLSTPAAWALHISVLQCSVRPLQLCH